MKLVRDFLAVVAVSVAMAVVVAASVALAQNAGAPPKSKGAAAAN